ncbi:hypothetical protein EDB84DRAFT_1560664 [Lactarius hengduanensis]|nr:hypothetical protein EDB84DRAFT_1560664 [Lactarius hengduanensis]
MSVSSSQGLGLPVPQTRDGADMPLRVSRRHRAQSYLPLARNDADAPLGAPRRHRALDYVPSTRNGAGTPLCAPRRHRALDYVSCLSDRGSECLSRPAYRASAGAGSIGIMRRVIVGSKNVKTSVYRPSRSVERRSARALGYQTESLTRQRVLPFG